MFSHPSFLAAAGRLPLIDPTNLLKTEKLILGILLDKHIRSGKRRFTTQEIFQCPVISADTWQAHLGEGDAQSQWYYFKLTHALNVVLLSTLPSQEDIEQLSLPAYFHIEVLSGNYLANEAFGPVEEVIGFLEFNYGAKAVHYMASRLHVFNPASLKPFQTMFLAHMLENDWKTGNAKEKIYNTNAVYRFQKNGVDDPRLPHERFKLSQLLYRRFRVSAPCNETQLIYPDDVRYEIIPPGRSLLCGNFGEVRFNAGVLIPKNDQTLQYNYHKSRAAKFLFVNLDDINEYHNEYRVGKLLPAFHFKPLVFAAPDNKPILLMKRIRGQNIAKFLKQDKGQLETSKRMEIVAGCLYALSLLHLKKITHRDIKPANIMIDPSTTPVTVRIIDYGLSCLTTDKNKDMVGTPLYSPPEFFDVDRTVPKRKLDQLTLKRGLDAKSDTFNLAWTLNMVLKGDDNKTERYDEAKQFASNVVFNNLFHGITDLTSEHQNRLAFSLQAMVHVAPDNRPSPLMVLDVVDQLILEANPLYLQSEKLKKKLLMGFFTGVACRKAIYEFLKLFHASADNAQGLRVVTSIVQDHLSQLKMTVKKNKYTYGLFANLQYMDCLRGLNSRSAIEQKVSDVIQHYIKQANNLIQLRQKIVAMPQQQPTLFIARLLPNAWRERMLSRIDKQLQKSNVALTLDELVLVGAQYEKYHQEFVQELSKTGRSLLQPSPGKLNLPLPRKRSSGE